MQFPHPLIEGRLIQRYKRFLADVELEDGSVETVHCPNPGAMLGLKEPGSKVWISDSHNPKRKLRYTFELIEADDTLVCVNTNLPNKIGREAIEDGLIPSLKGYGSIKAEVKYGVNSRIDLLLSDENRPLTYVEIKNSHLLRTKGLFEFPDCVTARGAKHLVELSNQVKIGHRAVMLFVIQRMDGNKFALARDMDPNYAAEFDKAIAVGVEAFAVRCEVSTTGIIARNLVPIEGI
ncbi:MAG: DNA/RNA nuclease SfsA [Rhizobiaceae bacterium]|nr:DNA/RNA nuclease SfsA [Rhizobiaceae bacterium]MBL4695289.1 DNA/RNA nuclease SfsA [Rhizobiaceae bacterium]